MPLTQAISTLVCMEDVTFYFDAVAVLTLANDWNMTARVQRVPDARQKPGELRI
jgi:hypothetical protein